MTKEALSIFLEKSGVPLSYIARETGINRTELSFHLHGHRDLTFEKAQKLKRFVEEYTNRWKE